MAATSRPAPRHFPALDGVRGIAIVLVLAFHIFAGTTAGGWRGALLYVPKLGWSGVDLFFVLSGFLITTGLLQARHGTHAIRNFFARRALRLLPLYYLFLLAWFGVLMHVPAAQKQLGAHEDLAGALPWFLFHGQNIWFALRGSFAARPLTPLWSLAVEEQFYVVWPFVMLFLSPRMAKRLCWSVVLGAGFLRLSLLTFDAIKPVSALVLMPLRADALCAGALVALAYAHPSPSVFRRYRAAAPVVAVVALVTLLLIQLTTGRTSNQETAMQVFGFPALLALYASLITWAIAAPAESAAVRALGHGSARAFGRYSYAIYLLHTPIILVVEHAVDRHLGLAQSPIARGAVCLALVIPLSLAVGALSWRLIESPLLKLKARLPMPGAAGAETAGEAELKRAA